MRLAVIALGDLAAEDVDATISRQFGNAEIRWIDRRELRHKPLQVLLALRRPQADAAVLVARDLSEGRLRLTSLILALPHADSRWRVDLRGARERWTLAGHLRQHVWPVARHVAACALAAALGGPVLRAIEAFVDGGNKALPSDGAEARILTRTDAVRILYLRSQLWLGLAGGGSVAHTAGVISGLQECGAEVNVVSSDALSGVSAPTRIVRPEVWFDGWLRELEDLAYNVAFLLGALKTARTTKPNVIYQRHTAFNVAGAVLSRLLHLPLVLEFNSSEVWKGRYWGGLRLTEVARSVERINLRAAQRIVVVSTVLRDELIAQGVPACKILVNPNAVDPRVFTPEVSGASVRARLGMDEQAVVIGFSGTFGMWHGIPTLASAISRVLCANADVHWLLIGDGPLRPLIKPEEHVHQVGMVTHAEMPVYLAACDILVSPHGRQADGHEFFGSPTKLYEYMGMGRAIVASRVGQIGDVLANEQSALLVEPDDPEALARAILRLVEDPCLRARLGAAARSAAESRHTWRRNAERVLTLGATR